MLDNSTFHYEIFGNPPWLYCTVLNSSSIMAYKSKSMTEESWQLVKRSVSECAHTENPPLAHRSICAARCDCVCATSQTEHVQCARTKWLSTNHAFAQAFGCTLRKGRSAQRMNEQNSGNKWGNVCTLCALPDTMHRFLRCNITPWWALCHRWGRVSRANTYTYVIIIHNSLCVHYYFHSCMMNKDLVISAVWCQLRY